MTEVSLLLQSEGLRKKQMDCGRTRKIKNGTLQPMDRFRPSTPVWQDMMESCSMLLRENLRQIIKAQ